MGKETLLDTPLVSTKYFTWDGVYRMFVVEASTLEASWGLTLGKVWSGWEDLGFTLYNPKTRRSVKMVEIESEYHNHELVARVFKPADPVQQKELNFEVHILND